MNVNFPDVPAEAVTRHPRGGAGPAQPRASRSSEAEIRAAGPISGSATSAARTIRCWTRPTSRPCARAHRGDAAASRPHPSSDACERLRQGASHEPWPPARSASIMDLRRAGITDTTVLAAIERVPRELFVPEPSSTRPMRTARCRSAAARRSASRRSWRVMTQALRAATRLKVLEIGTGSGYQTAVLSQLSRRVYTIERHRGCWRKPKRAWPRCAAATSPPIAGDGSLGWPKQAPFDRIIVTAAPREEPKALSTSWRSAASWSCRSVPTRPTSVLVRVRRTRRPRGAELGAVRFVPLVERPRRAAGRDAARARWQNAGAVVLMRAACRAASNGSPRPYMAGSHVEPLRLLLALTMAGSGVRLRLSTRTVRRSR